MKTLLFLSMALYSTAALATPIRCLDETPFCYLGNLPPWWQEYRDAYSDLVAPAGITGGAAQQAWIDEMLLGYAWETTGAEPPYGRSLDFAYLSDVPEPAFLMAEDRRIDVAEPGVLSLMGAGLVALILVRPKRCVD